MISDYLKKLWDEGKPKQVKDKIILIVVFILGLYLGSKIGYTCYMASNF